MSYILMSWTEKKVIFKHFKNVVKLQLAFILSEMFEIHGGLTTLKI